MLTIIHGSDIVGSRKVFFAEKERFPDATLLQAGEVNMTDLAQIFGGGGLFETSKSIFIEQFLTEKRKGSEKDAVISYLVNQGKTHTVVLWEGKELTKAALTPFKTSIVKLHKLPSTLFVLLDAIRPGNGAQLLTLFHQTLETTEVEMVFFMLVRHFRVLIALLDKHGETITEVARLAPWQRGRLEKQARLWRRDLLIAEYAKLFEIETAQKTGALSGTLASAIDFFFVEL